METILFVDIIYYSPKGHSYVNRDMIGALKEAGFKVAICKSFRHQFTSEFIKPDLTFENEIPDSLEMPEYQFRKILEEVKPSWCVFTEYGQWINVTHDKVAICKELGIKTLGFLMYEKLDWEKVNHYKLYTKLIAPTIFQTKLMRKNGAYNTIYVPWGTNIEEIDSVPEPPRSNKVVFYHCAGSGGVGGRKNTQAVIDAYNKIKDETTDLIITHLGAKTFSRKEIISFTKYADIIINTSKWDTLGLNCQPKGSKVFTQNGVKNIEDIKIGETVLTHKNYFAPVINIIKGENQLYEIDCDYTSKVRLTGEHPILVINSSKKEYKNKTIKMGPEWKKTKDIKPYDFIAVPKPKHIDHIKVIDMSEYIDNKNLIEDIESQKIWSKYSKNMKDVKVSLGQLAKKYGLSKNAIWRILNNVKTKNPIELENKIRKEYDNYINKLPKYIEINEELSKLLGFFVAEGWTEKKSSFGFAFHIKEVEYHNFVLTAMKNIFGLDGKVRIRENCYQIYYFNELVKQFFEKSCGKYAYNKNVPTYLLNCNKNIQKEFIRGYFYGDGCINETKIDASTVSEKLAYNLKYMLLRLNILSKVTRYKRSKYCTFKSDRDFYVIRLCKSMESYNLFGMKYNGRRYEFYLEDNNYFYVKVNKITKIWVERVYNITVAIDHTYCGEVVLHNSLESNACGRPVLVCNTKPMNEIVIDGVNGLLVNCEEIQEPLVTCPANLVDVEDLAKKMSILKIRMILDTLQSNSRKYAIENYDWNKNKKEFIKLFQ